MRAEVPAGTGKTTGSAAARPAGGTELARLRTPRQLPAPPSSFVGRARELQQLSSALPAPGEALPAMPVWAIDGTGGVGKTWLVLRWAHEHAEVFPDGQLYVDLRGFGPSDAAMDPAAAVRGALDAFGVAAEQIPAELDAQAALYRSVLAGRRVLVVLDNARDAETGPSVAARFDRLPGCGDQS